MLEAFHPSRVIIIIYPESTVFICKVVKITFTSESTMLRKWHKIDPPECAVHSTDSSLSLYYISICKKRAEFELTIRKFWAFIDMFELIFQKLIAAVNTDRIEKSLKQKLFKIKFPTRKVSGRMSRSAIGVKLGVCRDSKFVDIVMLVFFFRRLLKKNIWSKDGNFQPHLHHNNAEMCLYFSSRIFFRRI